MYSDGFEKQKKKKMTSEFNREQFEFEKSTREVTFKPIVNEVLRNKKKLRDFR